MTERQSTQHSPRVDDALEKETRSLVQGSPVEARAQEWRQMEPPGDGEPAPDARITVDAIEMRSLLATAVRPSTFPGTRADLLAVAEEEYADPSTVELLASLPPDREFRTLEEVWEALGGETEQRQASSPPPASADSQPEPEPASAPSLVERATGVAITGGKVALGLTVDIVQRIRRRL